MDRENNSPAPPAAQGGDQPLKPPAFGFDMSDATVAGFDAGAWTPAASPNPLKAGGTDHGDQ